MLYHLFEFLQDEYNLVGASIFKYISFRASAAVLLSLLFSIVFGKRLIRLFRITNQRKYKKTWIKR